MEKKKVTAESPLSFNGLTLTPIVETRVMHYQTPYTVSYIAQKMPLVLIAVVHGEKRAYRITGEEISLDELVKEYPSVKEAVEQL